MRAQHRSCRAALGADRWRLGSLVIAESLVLSFVGGAAGVAAAAWSLPLLRDSMSPDVAPFVTGLRQATVDWQVLAVSFALSVGAGLASGLSTLSRTWRSNLVDGLRPGVAGTIGGRMFLRGGLVTVQVALVVVIAVSAGQMVQAFESLLATRVGIA